MTLLLALFGTTGGCFNVEDVRIHELLNERGFGTRAQGDATTENYVAGGDLVQFLVDPIAQFAPGAEMLALLSVPQMIGIDGTLVIPYVGTVPVLGLTEAELESMVTEQLQTVFAFDVKLQCRILDRGKGFYAFGETASGRLPFLTADFTFLEAMARLRWTTLANLGRIRVVRPDAQNPLVIEINLREMIQTGDTKYNIRLRENDIIIVPPTFFGSLTRFLQKLLEPLRVVIATMFGWAQIEMTYDILTNRNQGFVRGGFFF